MTKAVDVSRYLLSLADAEVDVLSNMQIQKLLYYSQGFHLAAHDGEAIFEDAIVAWPHGPVVVEVYHHLKEFGRGAVPVHALDTVAREGVLSERARKTIEAVYRGFGQFSGWRLREMTHAEPPWNNAWSHGIHTELTHDALRTYFLTRIGRATA